MNKKQLFDYSLDALLVFSCAAKHMNFTRAARELGVTQAAVSRRIHNLESQLGSTLFIRKSRRQLELTHDGNRLYQTVKTSLGLLDSVMSEIKSPISADTISITTTAGFASLWLMPRLAQFNEHHAHINVRLVLVDDLLDLDAENIDLGIRYGSGFWEHLDAQRLFTEAVYPVCSPAYAQKHPEINDLKTLMHADLLHVEEKSLTIANWKKWFSEFGLTLDDNPAKLMYNNYPLLMQSCIDGQGILLGWHHMIYDLIHSGKLIRPVPEVLHTDFGFYLVSPQNKPLSPNTKCFRDWLLKFARRQSPAS